MSIASFHHHHHDSGVSSPCTEVHVLTEAEGVLKCADSINIQSEKSKVFGFGRGVCVCLK